ncbi:MAG: alpha-amylase family glycosyl hydrolase [Candidatus Omnitrophota bacterium]
MEEAREAAGAEPVAFSAGLVDTFGKNIGTSKDQLYRLLMSYAAYIYFHNNHQQAYQIAQHAARLKPGKDTHDRSADRYLKIFINKFNTAKGSDIHKLKAAAKTLKNAGGLKMELQKEFPLRYDLVRHLIAYIDQIPEDGSEIGGDITMIGSPAKFIEYLESIKSADGRMTAFIKRVKKHIADKSEFLEEGKSPEKKPKITRQINLDAESESGTNKFRWLADNIARYKGYDAIQLTGSLQVMGPLLSPYEYAGLYFEPRYGTDEDFRSLLKAARKNGIEIIVDVVFEHTGVSDSAGRPFPDMCYADKAGLWTNKLDYSKDETVALATWFLRRLRNLGVKWIRCDQMGGLGDKGHKVWENAHMLGLGIIGEWEYFPHVPQADFVYSKSKKDASGIYEELKKYGNGNGGKTSFETLQNLLRSRVWSLPEYQSSWVIFDDHDEGQYAPIINAIGKDSNGEWNPDKLKAYYLGVYMAWLSLPEKDRSRISIMEYSGTAEGYPNPLSFMYASQEYVDLAKEGEKLFPGFSEFSKKVRETVKEILDHKGKVEVKLQSVVDEYEKIIEIDLKDETGSNSMKMYTFCVDLKENRYRADIRVIEKDKLSRGMMDPAALLFLRSGQVVTEPKWSKLQAALNMVLKGKGSVTAEGIKEKLESEMKALGILKQDVKLSAEYVAGLLDELSAAGLVTKDNGSYGIFNKAQKQKAALWCNDYDYIRKEIMSKLGRPSQLMAILLGYEEHAQKLWSYYPVEAYYPIWDAISTMDKSSENKLIEDISDIEKDYGLGNKAGEFYNHPIFNTIRLTLQPSSEIPDEWLEKYAKNIIGKTIVIAAPEISRMAGGLGRVTVFKSVAIKRFVKDKARLVWAEPYYNDFNEDPGKKIMDDLEVEFRGRTLQCEVYMRIKQIEVPNEKGDIEIFEIEDYLVRDKDGYYVGKLYKYDQEDSRVAQDEFTDFFSSAVIVLTNRMAEMADKTMGKKGWKDVLLSLHDGQVLPAAFYRRFLYQKDPGKYKTLAKIPVSGFTHTYNNRVLKHFKSIEEVREFLKNKRYIDDAYHYLYLRKLDNGEIIVDDSSVGLRTSHMPSGVSRIQAFEMSYIDARPLRGLANGDLRELSAKEFRKILLELYPGADVEHPTVGQMISADKKAKESLLNMLKEKRGKPLIISGYLDIDPEKFIISYSGRCVPEKLGIGEGNPEQGGTEDLKAFTKENIRRSVKEGAQVIIFGNVQPYEPSIRVYKELKELAEEIENDKNKNGNNSVYKGTFILVDKFTPDEQRVLLAATQLQVQVSRRRTGAEEYKESAVTDNGGKQLAAPWIEGGTQLHGKVGVNVIVPYDNTEQAFWEAMEKDIDLYYRDRNAYALTEVNSIPLSRKLNVLNEMAAYLAWWSDEIKGKDTFDIELAPRNNAMTAANVNLSVYGIQISGVSPSLGDTMLVDLSDGYEDISINLRIAPGIEPPRVYVRTNALSSPDTPDNAAWMTIPLELTHFYNGQAVYLVRLKGIKREDCALTWKVGDIWLGNPSTNAILKNHNGLNGKHRATDL